jgi:hypothetical protein
MQSGETRARARASDTGMHGSRGRFPIGFSMRRVALCAALILPSIAISRAEPSRAEPSEQRKQKHRLSRSFLSPGDSLSCVHQREREREREISIMGISINCLAPAAVDDYETQSPRSNILLRESHYNVITAAMSGLIARHDNARRRLLSISHLSRGRTIHCPSSIVGISIR